MIKFNNLLSYNKIKAIKLLIISFALYFVASKINLHKLLSLVSSLNISYLLLAILSLFISQILSGFRLYEYLKTEKLNLSIPTTMKLYFKAMLYNNILPGGIGGDGLQIYLLHKDYKLPKLSGLKILIATRANGLLLLIFFALIIFYSIARAPNLNIGLYIVLAFVVIALMYFAFAKFCLSDRTLLKASFFSFWVQLFSIISGYFLLIAIKGGLEFNDILIYLLIFLVSSILSIIPVSIGGVGIRELTFLYGTKYASLSEELGVTFALIYYVISLVISLFAISFCSNSKQRLAITEKGD